MSKKKLLRYTIDKEGYSRQGKYWGLDWGKSSFWRNFETAKTMRQAMRKARKMGAGAIIQQVSVTRSGIIKVKEWEYTPKENE